MGEDSRTSPAIDPVLTAWAGLYSGDSSTEEHDGFARIVVRHPDFRAVPGNWPTLLYHGHTTPRVLVLIHGLQDSPGYMDAIARRFAARGVNVVLPLLPGHGRREPRRAMQHAKLPAWRTMVDRAVDIARRLGDEVSIGGLSTGGALAADKALRDRATISGKIYLFSAAMGFAPHHRLLLSTMLVSHTLEAIQERRDNTGIGGNPWKYSRRFLNASHEVYKLSRAVADQAGDSFAALNEGGRVFVAHSEADTTIPIAALRPLVDAEDAGQHYIIPESSGVAHAELVLDEDLNFEPRWPTEPPPPRANPEFEPMIGKALAFLER